MKYDTVMILGMEPQVNSLMVVINNRQQVVAVVTNQEGMVLHHHSHKHQLPHTAKLVHTNKVAIPRQDTDNSKGTLPHNQLILLISNHQALHNMVVRRNPVTNRVATKVMVAVATHLLVQLSLVGTVKAMVVNREGIHSQVVIRKRVVKVVINLAVTSSNSMVDDLTREMVVMVVVTGDMVVIVVAVAGVVIIVVVAVVIVMVTAVVDMVVVVVIVAMVIKEDMEGT